MPRAKRGYSWDHRPDCVRICSGVVVGGEGWPTGYQTYEGNIRDHQTLKGLPGKLAERHGALQAVQEGEDPQRVVVTDRGLLTEADLKDLREARYEYVMAERRARARAAKWCWTRGMEESWSVIRKDANANPEVEVEGPEIGRDGPDRRILVRSAGCPQKERGIHDRVLKRLKEDLEALKATIQGGRLCKVDEIQRRMGKLQERHGAPWEWLKVEKKEERFELPWEIRADVQQAMRQAEGVYLLRSDVPKRSPQELWEDYMRLAVVEAHLPFSFLACVGY